jgi:putative membrane protein
MLPVVGGFALVQVRRLANNYRFTVTETAAGLQVRRGLLELSSQTIALPRVQGVVVTEPLLWRPLGWARLDVSVASHAHAEDNDKPSASTVLPVGDRDEVVRLARHVLGGLEAIGLESGAEARRAEPAGGLTRPPRRAAWAAPVGWRFMAAGVGPDVVVGREGWVARRTHLVPHARVQSLRITQGPWQRRLGLADLHVDSPPGPVHVRARHRWAVEARALLEEEAVRARAARLAARRPGP